jgi:hypothetical protein
MRPPSPAVVPGARLILVPAAAAPRPTRAAVGSRLVRNADLGLAAGPAQQQAMAQAAADLTGGGVTLGAGAAHLWDLPTDLGTLTLSGSSCVRMMCADRSGAVLLDTEFSAAGSQPQQLPAGTEMLLIQALGAGAAGTTITAHGPGAISSSYAPAGQAPAVGWQAGGTLLQVGPTSFAARGASVKLARAYAGRSGGQRASYATVPARDAVAGQAGVETTLPIGTSVVLIALDLADPAAAQAGDLAIGCLGGTLAAPPQRVATGNRRLLCYDVTTREQGAAGLTISVASASAWSVGAVVGLPGSAVEWATKLSSGLPDNFVPDGPITPGGSVTATYAAGGEA